MTIVGGDDSYVLGGLCAENCDTITNCYVTGSVTCNAYLHAGSLLCGNNLGTVTNCKTTGQVMVNEYGIIGGLCGTNYGTISDYDVAGQVNDNEHYGCVGGLCGSNSGTITSCYATGSVTGNGYLGGLCGHNSYGIMDPGLAIISQCYHHSLGQCHRWGCLLLQDKW